MQERSFDWRLPAVWAVLLTISVFAHAYVEVADSGYRIGFGRAVVQEAASHIMVAALLPAIYWLHRRFPLGASPRNILIRNILIHALAIVPFSVTRTVGMTGLRLLWFVGLMGERYSFPLTADRLFYEFSKDIVNYAMLSAAVVALRYILERKPSSAPALPPTLPPALPTTAAAQPERFAVRKRGGNEVVVEVADIDWIEAAGNYAVLHVGGDTFEIRSSLTKLEAELDPKRFVRSPQVTHGEHCARHGSDTVDQRRLAHPPAGWRGGQSQPTLSPAFRGLGARPQLKPVTVRHATIAGRPADRAGRHNSPIDQGLDG